MNTIAEMYLQACATPGDINEHMPTLRRYAWQCKHITEFGVRNVVSTWAFAHARPDKFVSYDIATNLMINAADFIMKRERINWQFIQGDTLKIDIEKTDLLFIDTLHTEAQLTAELTRHHRQVRKYIILHDTFMYGIRGEDGGRGLTYAMVRFIEENPKWNIHEVFTNNNGLTVLKRK